MMEVTTFVPKMYCLITPGLVRASHSSEAGALIEIDALATKLFSMPIQTEEEAKKRLRQVEFFKHQKV